MWNQIKKWAAEQGITVGSVNDYMDAISYFNYYYGTVNKNNDILALLDSFSRIPVVALPMNIWKEYSLTGTGYLVKDENIGDAKRIYEWFRQNPSMKDVYDGTDYMRDYNIYRIYQKVSKTPFFIVIKDAAEAVIVHELAHMVGHKLNIKSVTSDIDPDEYMASESEQFALGHEMRYYKLRGRSFDDYIQTTQPELYQYLEAIKGGLFLEPRLKRDVELDYRDYKNIWDRI